jgi:predicted metalloprotease with PDZ domain
MFPKKWLVMITVVVFAGLADSSRTRADSTEPIVYTVSVPARAQHFADITAVFPTDGAATIDMMMPIWSPGFYRVENYAGRVQDLVARAPNNAVLDVTRPKTNRWQIQSRGATRVNVAYRLLCTGQSVTTNWVGSDFAVLNGPATFITLVGQTSRTHEVEIQLPAEWKQVVTALDSADGKPNHYRAADFDTLADSPIVAGNPAIFVFDVNPSKHELACVGDLSKWDGRRAAQDLERIVRGNKQLWGSLPYKQYDFLLVLRRGGGGLEHKNSTLMMTDPAAMTAPERYARWLSFASHEYFHTYNVKRLRPIELGPFDYEHEPHTPSLWIAEGVTNYYADLIPCRVGVFDRAVYLSRLSSYIKDLQSAPGRRVQSLERASLDVWTSSFSGVGRSPKTISYYTKGAVVGFLLDARIRRASGGAKSLDDAMRLAYIRYSGDRGFTAPEFRQAAEECAGTDLKDWFQTAIASTDELDYGDALDWFGLRFVAEQQQATASWQLELLPNATPAQREHFDQWLRASSR